MRTLFLHSSIKQTAIFLIFLPFVFCVKKNPDSPENNIVPFEFVMGTQVYSIPEPSIPSKGVPIQDATFYSSVVRITDKAMDGYSGAGIENEYARVDPENYDGTYFILRGNDGEWYLYNASNFQKVKSLLISGGGEEPEPRWDNTNPKIFYYLNQTALCSYNIDTDVSTIIHDFKTEIPNAFYVTTKTEGDASLDRNFWCLMVEDSAYNLISVIVYDKSSGRVLGQKSTFPDGINWVSMDMSGTHCVIGYEDSDIDADDITPPVQAFSRDFSAVVTLPAGATGHMDLAKTLDGKDVMVYQNNATDWIAMADLSTGAETPLLEIPFATNGDIGLHISGNSSKTPGWVVVSTYGSKNPPTGSSHSWMDCQVFMLELKSSPRIWRIAYTFSYTSRDYNGDKNYFAEAFASINNSGTKIYFGSNWNNFTSDYSDAYRIILPAGWSSEIP